MKEQAQILLVEDEPKIASLLSDYLEQAGYDTQHLDRGDEVIDVIKADPPDLILLDIMLPGVDGLTLCREIRAFSAVPIIMLTARVEELDRLLGLELGADDYICKPFSPREVMARIKALLRRVQLSQASTATPIKGLVLEPDNYRALLDGRDLGLTAVEFRLLSQLYSQPGRVFSREQLLNQLYDDHRVVTDRTVDSHIKNLRRKIQQIAPGRNLIRSIYGVGYRLEDEPS